MSAEINRLKATKKNSELDQSIKGLVDGNALIRQKIEACKAAAAAPSAGKKGARVDVLPNDSKSLKTLSNLWREEWIKMKRKCTDFVDRMADGMEKKPKECMKLLDIETDESEGVSLPEKYNL